MAQSPLHPVAALEGIGSATHTRLARLGVRYAEQLLMFSTETVASWLQGVRGLTSENIRNYFIPQARFLRLANIDPQMAEGLVLTGMYTYRDVATCNLPTVRSILATLHTEGTIDRVPTDDEITEWKLDAARLVAAGNALFQMIDKKTHRPVRDATVRVISTGPAIRTPVSAVSNKHGMAFVDGLVPGDHHATISGKRYRDVRVVFAASADKTKTLGVPLVKGRTRLRVADEFKGDFIQNLKYAEIRPESVKLEILPFPPPVHVVEVRAKDVKVSSLLRRKENQIVRVFYFYLPKDRVPRGVARGQVLVPGQGGRYRRSRESIVEFRKKFLQSKMKDKMRAQHG